jgi:hypothetical protein
MLIHRREITNDKIFVFPQFKSLRCVTFCEISPAAFFIGCFLCEIHETLPGGYLKGRYLMDTDIFNCCARV